MLTAIIHATLSLSDGKAKHQQTKGCGGANVPAWRD